MDKPNPNDPLRRSMISIEKLVGYLDNDVRLKQERINLLIQILFYVFFLSFVFEQDQSRTMYEMQRSAKDLFEETPFMSTSFTPYALYPFSSLSSNENNFLRLDGVDDINRYWSWVNNVVYKKVFYEPFQDNYTTVQYQNWLPYGFRFRSIRMKENSNCKVPLVMIPLLQSSSSISNTESIDCIANFDQTYEETSPYNGYSWSNTNTTKDFSFNGKMATYPASGYVVDILRPTSLQELQAVEAKLSAMQTLGDTQFIDTQTRAVAHNCLLYNPNFESFVSIDILIEFTASNNVHKTTMYTSKAIPLNQPTVFALGVIVDIMILLFLAQFFYIIYVKGIVGAFSSAWMWLDLVLLGFLIAVFVLTVGSFAKTNTTMNQAAKMGYSESIYDIRSVLMWNSQTESVFAYTILLLCVRTFKFAGIFQLFQIVQGTLERMMFDTLRIMVFYGILCPLLVLGLMLAIGDHFGQCSSFGSCVVFLYGLLIGSYSETHENLLETFGQIIPLLFIYFLITFFLILQGLFAIVVIDAWSIEMKEEMTRFRFSRMLKGITTTIKRYLCCCIPSFSQNVNEAEEAEVVLIDKKKWVENAVVLERIQIWMSRKRNIGKAYMSWDDIYEAIQGYGTDLIEPDEWQVRDILLKCSDYLVDSRSDVHDDISKAGSLSSKHNSLESDKKSSKFEESNIKLLKRIFIDLKLARYSGIDGDYEVESLLGELHSSNIQAFNQLSDN